VLLNGLLMLQVTCCLHAQFQTYFHSKVITYDAELREYNHLRESNPFQLRHYSLGSYPQQRTLFKQPRSPLLN